MAPEALELLGLAPMQQPFAAAKAQVGAGQAHHHRTAGGRGFIAPPELFAGFHQAEGAAGAHPQPVQGLPGNDLAHATFKRQPTIAAPAPGGGAAALAAQVLEIATDIAQLAVEEAATVAEEGVVGAELGAVIAQGQQGLARLEAAIGRLKVPIRHGGRIKPQLLQQGVIAKTQAALGEGCRFHPIPVGIAQALDRGLKGQGQQGIRGGSGGSHRAEQGPLEPAKGLNHPRTR